MCSYDFIIAQHYYTRKGMTYIAIATEIEVFHFEITIFSVHNQVKNQRVSVNKLFLFI